MGYRDVGRVWVLGLEARQEAKGNGAFLDGSWDFRPLGGQVRLPDLAVER